MDAFQCVRGLSDDAEVRAEEEMECRRLSVSQHPESRWTLNTKVIGFVGVVPGDGTKVWERYIWTRGEQERRVRVRKWTDVPLHYPPFKARRHEARGLPGGCQIRSSKGD
jgi:hypothetical protein